RQRAMPRCRRFALGGQLYLRAAQRSKPTLHQAAAEEPPRTQAPPFDCIALVLQGGGALGAFQAGVYQGLAEANLHPDWIAGISIGAINAALIAGNAPEARLEKLRAFWEQVTTQLLFDPFGIAHYWLRGDMGHVALNRLRAGATLLEGAPGFFKPRIPPPYLAPPGTIEATSWYDTTALRSTLERLVDFDR